MAEDELAVAPPTPEVIAAVMRAMTSPAYAPPEPPARAKSASKKLTAAPPDEDAQHEVLFALEHAKDMNVAITGVAYIEHALEGVLRDSFIALSKDDDARIFDGRTGGILGGFAAKIRLAYAIGIVGPVTYSDLHLLNDIRNAFAHSLHRVDFNHPDVADDCAKLQLIDRDPEYDWSEFADERDVPKYRFFMEVIDLYVALLHRRFAISMGRRHRSLVDAVAHKGGALQKKRELP